MTLTNSKLVGHMAAMWLCMLLCALAWHGRAHAQAPDPAQELFIKGLAEAREGRLEQAVELFVRSRALSETPNTLLNLAIMQSRLGRYPDALATLDALEARPDAREDPARAEKSQKLRAQARAAVAELELLLTPSDASVSCDGQSATPPVRLLPGNHVLRFAKDGFATQESTLTLIAGERRSLQVSLQPIALAPVTPPPEDGAAPGPRLSDGSQALVPSAAGTVPREDAGAGDRRVRRIALWVGAAVLVAAGGTVGVVWLTRDDSPKAPAGELPF